MIDWNRLELEEFLGGHFSVEGFVDPEDFSEIAFEAGGLVYSMLIGQKSECVTLRADLEDADQACPAFEMGGRCNRIKISDSCYGGKAIFFYFVESEGAEPSRHDLRMALERLPNGRLYAWPVIGKFDPPLEP